jgi:hypothetical protein
MKNLPSMWAASAAAAVLATGLLLCSAGCGTTGYAEVDSGYYGPGYVGPGFYDGAWYGGGDYYGHPAHWYGGGRVDYHGGDHGGGHPGPSIPHNARPGPAPASRGGGGGGGGHAGGGGQHR